MARERIRALVGSSNSSGFRCAVSAEVVGVCIERLSQHLMVPADWSDAQTTATQQHSCAGGLKLMLWDCGVWGSETAETVVRVRDST